MINRGDVETDKRDFLIRLETLLEPFYQPGQIAGGHDVEHVRRMVRMGPRIADGIPSLVFDQEEYVAAVWLHNLDRVPVMQETIKLCGQQRVVMSFLEGSNFDERAKVRIADAVIQHPKKDDDPIRNPGK